MNAAQPSGLFSQFADFAVNQIKRIGTVTDQLDLAHYRAAQAVLFMLFVHEPLQKGCGRMVFFRPREINRRVDGGGDTRFVLRDNCKQPLDIVCGDLWGRQLGENNWRLRDRSES